MLANFFLPSLLAQKHKWIFLKLVMCCYLLTYLFMLCPDYNSHLAFPNKLQFVVSNYVYCSIGWRNGHNIKYLLNFLALYRFSIHVLTLTCGQLCVMIEERLWIQAGEMNFL